MDVCVDNNIDDIEDLISKNDVTPKERYQNKKNVTVRAKVNGENKENRPEINNGTNENQSIIPGTQTIYVKTWGCTHNNSDTEYMVGQLAGYGYKITSDKSKADLWLLNSCTVKNPSEDTFRNDIQEGQKKNKHVVVAGCVPQGAPKSDYLKGLSIVGVHQIDRVVEVVEETMKGHSVRLLQQKKENGKKVAGPSLSLPKIRKNPLIEIIPINSGCLNQCTYCKTKHARGDLVSYEPHEIVERAIQAFSEGVCEIWLTSEDTGTYGRDIGTSLPELLWKLVEVIPDGCMLRIGMTNPPYIMEHLDEISKILNTPKVYSFLHIPVQSGSDAVLSDMKREYSRNDFEHVVNFLRDNSPGISIATDIICGFPSETEDNFDETMTLCEAYKFPSLFINQFFPRPGTPAARMVRIPANLVKKRTKRLTELFNSYEPYRNREGKIYTALVTEISHDKKYYVGHNKFYEQILLPMEENLMGKSVKIRILSSTKFSMFGELIENENEWKECSIKSVTTTSTSATGIYENTNGILTNDNLKSNENNSYIIYSLAIIILAIVLRFVWKWF